MLRILRKVVLESNIIPQRSHGQPLIQADLGTAHPFLVRDHLLVGQHCVDNRLWDLHLILQVHQGGHDFVGCCYQEHLVLHRSPYLPEFSEEGLEGIIGDE